MFKVIGFTIKDTLFKSGNLHFPASLILAAIIAILTFPGYEPVYSTGIDPPLAWVFNTLFQDHSGAGQHFIFPHGPLAFFMYPLGNNLILVESIYFLVRMGVCLVVMNLYKDGNRVNWLPSFLISLLLLNVLDNHRMLVALTAGGILLYRQTKKRRWIWLAAIACAFSLYMKAYAGIISSLLCLSFILIDFYENRNYRFSMLFISGLIVSVSGTWLFLFKNFSGLPGYFYGMMQLSSDNSEAVSFYPENNWLALVLMMIFLFLIPFIQRDKRITMFYAFFVLALFASWKHAMAREDYSHSMGFFSMLVLFYSFLFPMIARHKAITGTLAVLSLCCFYFNEKNTFDYAELQFKPLRINEYATFVSTYKKREKEWVEQSAVNISKNTVDKNIHTIIGNKTVDVYPWDYSFIPANRFTWKPRPVIHSYAAYTSWLDRQNARHFSSPEAPDYLLIEMNKETSDINEGRLESLDNRYLLNDEPNTLLTLLNTYRFREKNSQVMLWEKKNRPYQITEKKISESEVRWNQWIDIPDVKDGIVRAKTIMEDNFWGSLKGFFYKKEEFFIYYLLETGTILRYKIVPANAADGIWINPLMLHPENNYFEPLVKKIQFRCSNTALQNKTLHIEWNVAEITNSAAGNEKITAATHSPLYQHAFALFGKNKKSTDTLVFHSINTAGDSIKNWSNAGLNRIQDNTFSPPYAYRLSPNSFSSSLTINMDSLAKGVAGKQFLIRAGAWVKGIKNGNINLVISLDDDKGNVFWVAANSQAFILDEKEWNYFIINKKINRDAVTGNKSRLSVYLWNAGTKETWADDIKISVELLR